MCAINRELSWEMLIWYNLSARERAWSVFCEENNNSKKPEDWSAPCCKRMSKALSIRRGNWTRNKGERQRATLVKKVENQTPYRCSTNRYWIMSRIFFSVFRWPLSFPRDPYWWNKSTVLPPCNLSILIHDCRCDKGDPHIQRFSSRSNTRSYQTSLLNPASCNYNWFFCCCLYS